MTNLSATPADALVIGSGGREHAIVNALKPHFKAVYALPGNPGMRRDAETVPVSADDYMAIGSFAGHLSRPLIVVGPEQPLTAGLADRLRKKGFDVFGPGADGARLEGSKAFSKQFMARHGIPTADFWVCTEVNACRQALQKVSAPFIVKADGLAAGKGVFIETDRAAAEKVYAELLGGALGTAGKTVVIEENLPGWELSVFVLTDGNDFVVLPTAQDHKRIFDGDQGPNTGGMGAYTPVAKVTPALRDAIRRQVVIPTLTGLRKDGIDYRGVLYIGLMVDETLTPKVLEYNVRFGDPEAQVLFTSIDVNWGDLLRDCAAGTLNPEKYTNWVAQPAATVVAAAPGYPGKITAGAEINGIDAACRLENTWVFCAGVAERSGTPVTAGGRVLSVTATGASVADAVQKAYAGMNHIRFDGMQFRRDIGAQALKT